MSYVESEYILFTPHPQHFFIGKNGKYYRKYDNSKRYIRSVTVTEKIEYVFYVEKIMKIKKIEERFIQLSEFDNKALRLISFHLFR